MTGYLATSAWGHIALIVFWAFVLAGTTLLAAWHWIGPKPAKAPARRIPLPRRHSRKSTPDGESGDAHRRWLS